MEIPPGFCNLNHRNFLSWMYLSLASLFRLYFSKPFELIYNHVTDLHPVPMSSGFGHALMKKQFFSLSVKTFT